MKSFAFASLLLVTTAVSESYQKMPPFLKICHRNDPNLDECIKDSVNVLKPYLKMGIPDLQIPPCEPLYVSRIEIVQAVAPVSVKSTYTNIKVQGGTDLLLKSVRTDIDKNQIKLKIFIERLQMIADYNMEGKIMILPISANGKFYGNFTNIDVVVKIQGERYQNQKTLKTHYKVTDFHVDFNVGDASIHLTNLFNGDEILSKTLNAFLNDNWKTVISEIKPALEDSISSLFTTLSNKLYSRYSLDTLLPA